MKKILVKYYPVLMALVVLISSCSKNDDNYDYRKMPTSVELPIAAHAGPASFDNGGFKYKISESISAQPQSLSTTVLLSAVKPLTKALTVTLQVDMNAVTSLNAAHRALFVADSTEAVKNGTDLPDRNSAQYATFVPLPSSAYNVPASTVTIGAGLLSANHNINLITSGLSLSTNYMLPLSITDAQGQAINYYKTVYYIIGIKSQYEGTYTANGSIAFPDPSINRSWTNRTKTLTTINGTTVRSEAADLSGSNYYMYLTVNADNSVTVKSAPEAANQTIQNNGVCIYDPVTKTFRLNYKYVGGTGDRRISESIKLN
ncbi:DUF1735 domain-containing protein [Mucilaginibacter gossypii]|uniref:BT_3987 domain-containing protein n=1 Tax=Mucilaginibacter gossypii TaxID=551996 RepID=UPI000DCBBA84|nr:MULTISPECIES: DUF1735 domain-containing protein [Mucilaginibacter]QTE37615.1 DUF1735 domain-containing protein [Mucilaginibacter gossypii]RAV58458.1 hypothetical protein DIU36_10150 [Mucilaginibacter rubeus]